MTSFFATPAAPVIQQAAPVAPQPAAFNMPSPNAGSAMTARAVTEAATRTTLSRRISSGDMQPVAALYAAKTLGSGAA